MLQDSPTSTFAPRSVSAIETTRLTLRKPVLADVADLVRLANDQRIAQLMRRLPHPFSDDHASQLLSEQRSVFVIDSTCKPVGAIELEMSDSQADLSLWLGCDHWKYGFATEASRAMIDYAFEICDVQHITASARVCNPPARNMLEKCGFQWTGVELHRYTALRSSTPVDCFKLTRGVWNSLKNWNHAVRIGQAIAPN